MSAERASAFTERELRYLTDGERRLARIATVGADGTPHVVPVGWRYDAEQDAIEIDGHALEQTKKYRDARRTGRAAIVIDDLASVDPWRPRGIEIRGRAHVTTHGRRVIRIYPERIVSWGLESDAMGQRHARSVPSATPAEARTNPAGAAPAAVASARSSTVTSSAVS